MDDSFENAPGPVDKIIRMKLKICLVGDRAVGKTSLLNRYVFNSFNETYEGTLGSRLCLLMYKDVVAAGQLVEAEVALFDLMGERNVRDTFKDVMFWGTDGFLAVADVTRPETIHSLPTWIETVQSVAGSVPYSIVMNKADLAPIGAISPRDTAWLLDTLPGVPYHLTSAKTQSAVETVFDAVIDAVVGRTLAKSRLRRQTRIIGDRILRFAERRGLIGVGKSEVLASFKGVAYDILMREIEDLRQLGLIVTELSGPSSFRIRITEKGEQSLGSVEDTERVVEAIA